eukprot:1583055-Rhodomonas_salina.2
MRRERSTSMREMCVTTSGALPGTTELSVSTALLFVWYQRTRRQYCSLVPLYCPSVLSSGSPPYSLAGLFFGATILSDSTAPGTTVLDARTARSVPPYSP